MRTPKLLLLTLSLGLGSVLALGSPAHACKCALQSVDQAQAQADAIFEGRVTKIEDVPGAAGADADKRVTFALVRVWKDLEREETVALITRSSSASCGYAFEAGQSYLVYASRSEQGLSAGACSRTRAMADASEDLAVLGGGITPVKIAPNKPVIAQEPKPAPKASGCASTSGQSHASLFWFGAPALGLAWRRRRGR
jgi:hypothetical protein